MKEGDWVITRAVVFGRKISAISYIHQVLPDRYITIGTKKYNGIAFVVPKENITPMKATFSDEDIDTLINMALDLKDKKWFNKLVELKQRKGMKK